MNRVVAGLLPVLAWAGCGLQAKPFIGAIVQMTLSGVAPSAPAEHYELWARNAYDDVLRVSGTFDTNDGRRLFPFGFTVRQAIRMDDPCMIDGAGHLLTRAEAWQDTHLGGVVQSAEEQAQQVRSRIAQLTAPSSCDGSGLDPLFHCGRESATVLGVVAHQLIDEQGNLVYVTPDPPHTCETSDDAPGCLSYHAAPADRLAACSAYWANPLAYTPNPLQLTAPLHGLLYGELTYVTTTPPSSFDSVRIDSNVGLKGVRELWITTEPDRVDGRHRGPILLDGTPDPGGLHVVHFDLTPPFGSTVTASGTATLLNQLDEDPVQF